MSNVELFYCLPSGQYYGSWLGDPQTDRNPYADAGYIQVSHAPESTRYFWDIEKQAFYLPPPTAEEILAEQTAKLRDLKRLASTQTSAINQRITTINDAVDLDMATPEEVEELRLRQVQRDSWKRYGVLLGRVAAQAGWPSTVAWPVQPVEGLDLAEEI